MTIKAIAKRANVSITTVSRALNGYPDVSKETKEKILKIAKEMNYVPNKFARSLVSNKSFTIGLLASSGADESLKSEYSLGMAFIMDIMSGINDYLDETNYDLILFNTDSLQQRNRSYEQLCKEKNLDGVIVSGLREDDKYFKEIKESSRPGVLIDTPILNKKIGYVTTNNCESSNEAVKHLINLGHKNIALINGHVDAPVSKLRLTGYKKALEEAGITINKGWIHDGKFSEKIAYNIAISLLKQHPEITAFFCSNDLMAIGVMRAAKDFGYNVPQRLSIIGFDDILLSSYVVPGLSTVYQDKNKMGYEAAKMLINVIENTQEPKMITLKNELKIRASTGKSIL